MVTGLAGRPEFPVTHCQVCGRKVLTHVRYEGDDELRACVECDTVLEAEPTAASADDTGAGSMIRQPNGSDTDDAATDWATTTTVTPGAVNVP